MNNFLKFYRGNVQNSRISLDHPIDIDNLLGNIKDEQSRKLACVLENHKELYFWDVGVRASRHIQAGDLLIIVTNISIYSGEILGIIRGDINGGIGDAIGWARQYQQPWKNPIAFKHVKKVSITTRKKREEIQDLINRARKIEANFYHLDNTNEQKTDKNNKELELLVNQISLLKKAEKHTEREHESLVEKFFLYLGYNYPLEIKYRVGHIDMLINPDSPNKIVVEVKRNWYLTKEDHDTIDQAYRYAAHSGARFVVITNGDYYAFFDRSHGLSIKDNFDFEIKLSDLTAKDRERLKKYLRSNL